MVHGNRFNFVQFALLAVGLWLGPVVHETRAAIVDVSTTFDGNKLNLSSIEVTSGPDNPNRRFTYQQLIKPTVVGYQSVPEDNATNTVTVFGTPDTTPPEGLARLSLLSDAALNTGIFNPRGMLPGITLTFERPLINGPGEDIVLFELTVGVGQTPDPVTIRRADGTGPARNVNSGQYQISDVIPIDGTPVTYLVTVGDGQFAVLDDLVNAPVTPSSTSNPKWHAIAINLNALGLVEGESIQSLSIMSGDRTRGVDLLLVAGLPPYVVVPEPQGLVLGLLASAILALVRRDRCSDCDR